MAKRANAWAVGDIETLRQIPEPLAKASAPMRSRAHRACRTSSEAAKKQVVDAWFASVEAALEQNDVTFAVLPMSEILRDDGRLAKLRERGYVIEPPAT